MKYVYVCKAIVCGESWIISVHRTRAGAYKSGRKWLIDNFNNDAERHPRYSRFKISKQEVED